MAKPAAKPRKVPRPAARLAPAEQARIAEIFARFEALESDPRTELNYDSPFTLVVAVALSAQATDVSVNKATARLFEAADTPQAMLALGEDGLKPFISSIGLFNTKAKNVIALSRILVEQYGGEVPLNREALQALPGVGRKTASVVLNELRVEPAIAVDTHVFRVSHRLGLSTGKTPDAVEAELMGKVPGPLLTPRPPLADPARPLHLRRAAPEMRGVPGRRPLSQPASVHRPPIVHGRSVSLRTRLRSRPCASSRPPRGRKASSRPPRSWRSRPAPSAAR